MIRRTTYPLPLLALALLLLSPLPVSAGTLLWPVDCIPGVSCLGDIFLLGYPDVGRTGRAFDCAAPGYIGHTGTDIYVTADRVEPVQVKAADDGEVILAVDGRYDRCPNHEEPDCLPPTERGATHDFCRQQAPGCGGDCSCLWGFDAGNYLLIRHDDNRSVSLTLYAHLAKHSLRVVPGQKVRAGEILAEVGSSGNSLTPHLHFSVWGREGEAATLVDPWSGPCNRNGTPFWRYQPPYRSDLNVTLSGQGSGRVSTVDGRIDCGPRCSGPFIPGSTVTLAANPLPGSRFLGWSGDCSGTEPECAVAIGGTVTVAARFRDIAPPVVTSFTVTPPDRDRWVRVTGFSADDNIRVSGYLITESPARPRLNDPGWRPVPPETYRMGPSPTTVLHAWARDPSGNISAPLTVP